MNSSHNLPWAAYIRCSTKDQAAKFSPVKQLMAEASWARANGVTIPGVESAVVGDTVRPSEYILFDKQTGKNDDRPDFQRGMELARTGKIGGLVGFCVDRCARNVVDAIKLRTTLKRLGVLLDFATQTFDYSPSGALMYTVFSAFAEFEGQVILERTGNGRLARVRGNAKEGKKPRLHSGGSVLYGYRYENGLPVIDEQESKIVLLILKMVAEEEQTAYKIFQWLNRNGYRTRKGMLWQRGGITQILGKAHRYAGTYIYRHGIEAAKREHTERIALLGDNAPPLDLSNVITVRTEDFYPPIISKEYADRIAAVLTKNKLAKQGRPSRKYLLAKMVWCLVPGCKHRWHPRPTRKSGAWACGHVNRHDTFQKLCSSRQVSCDRLDRTVIDGMREYLRQPKVARAMALQEYEATQGPEAQERKREFEERLKSITREQSHLDAQILNYNLPQRTRELAERRLKEVEIEMLEIRGELRQASVSVLPSEEGIIAAFTELLNELDHLETFDEKREFLECTVSRIETDGENVVIKGEIAPVAAQTSRNRHSGVGANVSTFSPIPFILKKRVA